MSTITVVRKGDQVAIAADSLTSGSYNRRERADYIVNHQKIFAVGDSFLAISGATSAKLALKRYFANFQKPLTLHSVEGIYETWLMLRDTLKGYYFLRPDEDDDASFESTRIDVLIANSSGIFGVARHGSVQEFAKFFAIGSGSDYALGALFAAYDDETKSAEELARLGVAAAIEWSSNSAAPILSQVLTLKSC